MTINPPPFIERFQYKNCKQVNQNGKRVYLTPDGESLPSVTTILSATKDMTHLNEWKKRIGEEKAAQITREAAGVGTAMHSNLERFVAGIERQPGNNLVHVQANKMADIIIEQGLSKVNEVWAMEQSLYFPGLYSGTTDLVGVHDGEPAVMDYKQTNKPKKSEWIDDYRLQLVAYIMAHNEVYKTNIRKGVVFMCSRDLQYQQFELLPEDFNKYQDMWLDKVEEYYTTGMQGLKQLLS
jgi:CRISPR/Cas system-associated exonuclease Cas4 (RecB family)